MRVNNSPAEDIFEAEFDDQRADAAEPGENVSVTGDKSDPEITVDLVNKAGRELPVTGHRSLAVFGLLGMGLIAAGRIRRKK